MLYRSKIISAVLLATVSSIPVASLAADMDGVVYADDANFVKPAELGSGWYLRGEVGINLNGNQDVGTFGNPVDSSLIVNNTTDGYNFSIGGGKRVNNYLRLEANIGRLAGSDYSTSRLMYAPGTAPAGIDPELIVDTDVAFDGTTSIDSNACNGKQIVTTSNSGLSTTVPYFITNCMDLDRVQYDTTFAMVNAYVDLPKMGRFQPFIGGGLGVGRVSWRQETDGVYCTPPSTDSVQVVCTALEPGVVPGVGEEYIQPGVVDEGVSYRLGYQVAGGVAYDVTDNLAVDTTYKYTRYGAGNFAGSDGATLGNKGFSVHQVNVGLRYSFF